MLRHEFRPGRAVVGIVMLAVAGGYAADAAGTWSVPWTFFLPLFLGGLGLAAAVTWLSYRLRRRREAGRPGPKERPSGRSAPAP
ncbi:hypothetical protein [Streptomyces nitrosporeus]|uniref:Uncharacterized protein n=1 Tax=Streptomyces nitrosporeus TaxID=28894 RepID=A0A5J6FB82_9ACTN|nr:hypothetical protein [Streptomyces nitrosporeus]QEU72784.1 hypothetical protein CP967_12970 [Streptomyces nitrosporeus]GGY75038.1 hypothetical protein GCM10010327_00950 [Streptomyces nitrosporeus]